jgi:hypothetical protein
MAVTTRHHTPVAIDDCRLHAPSSGARRCTRRPDRPRELDARWRPGSNVQDDEAIPADAAALNEVGRDQFCQTWVDFFDSHYRSDGGISHTRQYLLVVGTRR